MTFVRTIPPAEAEGRVREMYEQARERLGYVPNWLQAFSLRPGVRDGWTALARAIQANVSPRRYQLATLAAARALRSSYCSLAHAAMLAENQMDTQTLTAIVSDPPAAPLEPAERAMIAFVEKVVLEADRVTAADIEALKGHGYSDEEIFDLAATAAARCFFSKLLDALGVQADAMFQDLDPTLRQALTVGRPIAGTQVEAPGRDHA